MDLAKLSPKAAAEKGATLRLRHPSTDEPLDVSIEIVGRDSSDVQERLKAIKTRRSRGEEISQDAEGLELLLAVTKGWENIEVDGEALEYSEANARKLYTDPRTEWIAEQVGPFALSRRNFVKNLPAD